MELDPTIRTPREDARTPPSANARTWEGTYEAYLQTKAWRDCRDRALRRAGWKCAKCPAQRTLQVHHKTYVRLGDEHDEDLEVLCATCHEGHHIDEQQQVRGVYVMVVSEVLKTEKFTCMADLMEAVKSTCARNEIPYDGRKIWRAVSLVDANRHGILDAPKLKIKPVTPEALRSGELDRPVTKAESREFFRDHPIPIRTMAALEQDDYYRDMERANAMRRQCAEMLKQ